MKEKGRERRGTEKERAKEQSAKGEKKREREVHVEKETGEGRR